MISSLDFERQVKNLILFCHFFLSVNLSAQIEGIITDQNTKKPIAFANIWVENENIGTTSSTDGHFRIGEDVKNKQLFVSAIGYESALDVISKNRLNVELIPKVYELSEIKVSPRKRKKVVIGNIKKLRRANLGSAVPWILTRYVPYIDAYSKTPFIENVKIITESKIESAIFNFRIFKIAKDGKPGDDLLNKSMIIKVKKGKAYPVINLSEYKVLIPIEGLYIAVEWITTKENGLEIKSPNKNEQLSFYKYKPNFGCEMEKSAEHKWYFTNAKWQYYKLTDDGKYGQLAAEITISD